MSNKNVVDDLLKKIEGLEAQAAIFKERRSSLNEEARKWAEIRDSLNLECKKAREEISYCKVQRDQMNQTIRELKKNREDIKAQIEAKRQEHNKMKEKVKGLLSKTSRSEDETERRIKALDWKIQTNPLTKIEEAQVINQVKILEQQSLIHKEVSSLKEKIIESGSEIGVLKIRDNDTCNRISEYATNSQKYHNRMLEKIKAVERIKIEADQAHQKFVKCREDADINHAKYSELMKQINEINSTIRELEENVRKKRISEEIEAQASVAYKKLEEKRKLTLEEFRTLIKRGRI